MLQVRPQRNRMTAREIRKTQGPGAPRLKSPKPRPRRGESIEAWDRRAMRHFDANIFHYAMISTTKEGAAWGRSLSASQRRELAKAFVQALEVNAKAVRRG